LVALVTALVSTLAAALVTALAAALISALASTLVAALASALAAALGSTLAAALVTALATALGSTLVPALVSALATALRSALAAALVSALVAALVFALVALAVAEMPAAVPLSAPSPAVVVMVVLTRRGWRRALRPLPRMSIMCRGVTGRGQAEECCDAQQSGPSLHACSLRSGPPSASRTIAFGQERSQRSRRIVENARRVGAVPDAGRRL
jgi:hypothetical protein